MIRLISRTFCLVAILFLGPTAYAQLSITSFTPLPNTRNSPNTVIVAAELNQPLNAGSTNALRVYSNLRGGLRSTRSGTTTITNQTIAFSPTNFNWLAGETVFTSITRAATSLNNQALATPKVYQFTTATGGSGKGNFRVGSNIPSGYNPYAMEVGDVDGDGDLDMLVSDRYSSAVLVRLNGGDNTGSNTGVFGGTYNLYFSTGVSGFALGDIDGDGDLDIVAGLGNNIGVTIRLNGGDNTGSNTGQFGPAQVISLTNMACIELLDVDGDGDLDLLSTEASYIDGPAYVTLNGGNNSGSNTGVFSRTQTINAVGSQPTYGDVDGDGDIDIIGVNGWDSNATVTISLNGGNNLGSNTGVFSGNYTVPVASGARAVKVADIDQDNDLDIIVSAAGTLSIRLNGGDNTGSNTGRFSGGQDIACTGIQTTLDVGDVDADGDIDVVAGTQVSTTNTTTGDKVYTILNGGDDSGSGTGIFTPTSTTQVGSGVKVVALGDVDGDLDLDLLASTFYGQSVSVRLNQPLPPTILSFTPTSATAGTLVTLRGTKLLGATSLIISGKNTPLQTNSDDAITFYVPVGATPSGTSSVTTVGGTSTSTAFNALLRLVSTDPTINDLTALRGGSVVEMIFTEPVTAASAAGIRVFSTQVGGRKAGTVSVSSNSARFTATFGTPLYNFKPGEVVSVTQPATVRTTAGLLAPKKVYQFTTIVAGTGKGNFMAPAINPDPAVGTTPAEVAVGDIDGDGDLDLLTANINASTVSVRINNGAGNFTAPVINPDPAVGSGPENVTLGDVDGDGDLDFLTANYTSSTVSVRLNDGSGNFTAPALNPNPAVGTNTYSVVLGDLDGDGDLDLLAGCYYGNRVSVRLNDGSGNFTAPALNPNPVVGDYPQSVALGDVDRDGDLDLLAANFTSNSVSVRLNDGSGNFSTPATNPNVAIGSRPNSLTLGDVDGDGDLDLLTANSSNDPVSSVSVRLNQPLLLTVTSIFPTAELPGMPVTITGTGFGPGSSVSFGGVAASSVTYTSSTSLTVIVPANSSAGSSTVVVTSSGISNATGPAFTVLSVLDASTTGCLTTVPYAAAGDGQWHYLLTPSGQVVAALQDTRAALGSISVSYQVNGLSEPVRQDGVGHSYLGRNFQLTARGGAFPGASVNLRFYGLVTELDRLQAADATASASTLKATQYSGPNEDCTLSNNDSRAGELRLLNTAVSAPGAGVPWFAAEVVVSDHFSEFYLHGSSSPLPVELVSFQAEPQGSVALLQWSTAQELHNDRFEIQVSTDAHTFRTLAQVAGAGTSTVSRVYQWSDPHLQQYDRPIVYYRLRQVDTDGKANLSLVRSVSVPAEAPHLTAWPNPTRENLHVTGLAPGQRVEVCDAVGRIVASGLMPLAGPLSLVLPTSLPMGIYTVRGQGKACKVIVQ
jgi:hypothetical protein